MSVRSDLDAAWAEWMKPTSPGGKRSQGEAWRRDNPGEWAKLDAYRKGGARPTLSSNTGRQMLFETDAWHGAETEPPIPPPVGCAVDRATMTAAGCKILRSDTGINADPEPGLWGSIEAVSDSRYQHFTSGGDTHVKADGTSQGDSAYRRMTVIDGDDYWGERAELGRNWWQNGENGGSETDGAFALAHEGDQADHVLVDAVPVGVPDGGQRLATDRPVETGAALHGCQHSNTQPGRERRHARDADVRQPVSPLHTGGSSGGLRQRRRSTSGSGSPPTSRSRSGPTSARCRCSSTTTPTATSSMRTSVRLSGRARTCLM